jgi:hypothetical protein
MFENYLTPFACNITAIIRLIGSKSSVWEVVNRFGQRIIQHCDKNHVVSLSMASPSDPEDISLSVPDFQEGRDALMAPLALCTMILERSKAGKIIFIKDCNR